MLFAQRTWLIIGVFAASIVAYLVFQGSTQEAETETKTASPDKAADASYDGTNARKFEGGEVIVKLKDEASNADLKELNRKNDAKIEDKVPRTDVNLVDLPQDLTVKEAVGVYEDSLDVEYAEPNYILQPSRVPNDTYYSSRLWGLNNTGQTIGGQAGTPDDDIGAPEAWDTTTGKADTVVAVIDEGVDINHPDLKDNIWTNPGEIPGNNVDDDNNGYVDDVHGWDFVNNDASVYDPNPVTGQGDEHGTHVSGTIAAEGNNGLGVTGVNWQASIMPLKFLGPNGGSTLDAVKASDYVFNKGVKISSNSWAEVEGASRSRMLSPAPTRPVCSSWPLRGMAARMESVTTTTVRHRIRHPTTTRT